MFSRFLQPFDGLWHAILVIGGQDVLPQAWNPGALWRILFLMLVLALARWQLPAASARNWIFIACPAGLLLLWLIGSGAGNDILITQLQPWRCVWLLQVTALLALGELLVLLWQGRCGQRWLAAMLSVAMLQSGFSHTGGAFALALGVAGTAIFLALRHLPAERIERAPWTVLPLILPLPQLLSNATRAWEIRWSAPASIDSHDVFAAAIWAVSAAALLCVLIAARPRPDRSGSRRAAAAAIPLACVALTGAAWIWSKPYVDGIRSDSAAQASFLHQLQAHVPAPAVVYAEPGLRWTWFALQRSYYADTVQLSGVVFSRELGMEGLRRLKTLCNIGVPGCPTDSFQAGSGNDRNAFWQARIPALCADPALDELVLISHIAGAEIIDDSRGNRLSLVRCANHRKAPGSAG